MQTNQPPFGVLLVNLGTPAAPTKAAVRAFLKQFLSDSRVVDVNPLLWWCILNGIILNVRPGKVAKLYQSIWWQDGSPLMVISRKQQQALQNQLLSRTGLDIPVELGMSYGEPSLDSGLKALEAKGVKNVLVLPLYPQYSCSTVASVVDGVAALLKSRRDIPELRFVRDYHDKKGYIDSLAHSVRQHWQQHGQSQKLLLSFHGVPERYVNEGDPYRDHCYKTAELLAETLELTPEQWMVCFQSRFGKEPWLTPYTDETLERLPQQGVKSVDIISPAFAADCLETLEEISIGGKETFLHAGGESYRFVPCLNDDEQHMAFLAELALQHAQGWH